MAVTLTTNWQNIASGSYIPGTGFSCTFYLDAKYSTQSKENNTTTIQTRLNCVINQGYGGGYNYSFSCSYAGTVSGSGYWTLESETITSGGDTIKHGDDGKKTITLSANARINGISMNVSMSGEAKLPDIDRYPVLTGANDFYDDTNPSITFTKTLGFSNPTVQASICNSAGTTTYITKTIPNNTISSGTYTFDLTNTERNTLRNASSNSNTLSVVYKLKTTVGTTVYNGGTSAVKTMTIRNATPTLTNPTFSEQNAKVSALLGSSATTIVQNASTVRFGITATALKGASISKVVATHNGTNYTDTSSPYSFDIPIKSNGTITAVATDSRNNPSATYTKTWSGANLIEYKPVSIDTYSFKRQNETSSIIILNVSATYYQKTFGSTANVPIVKWKKDNGSWTTLTSSQYTIANNKLTINNLSLGSQVDYENQATFYLSIEDKLSVDNKNTVVSVGKPTLELGRDDVKINGDLSFAENNNASILWKEKGYGDKFRIIPAFSGTDDDNKLKIQGTVGGSGTDPTDFTDLLTVSGKTGHVNISGSVKAVKGIWSRPSGEVGTATSDSNSMLLIKRANNTEAPNNGVVLEYGNSANYRGQLYIGDNATQGIYYNGWSNGTRGTWRRLEDVPKKSTDANGWTVLEYNTRIEYYKKSTCALNLSTGISWKTFVVSDLPVGVSTSDNIYFSGSVTNWDSALIPTIGIHDNKIKVTAVWLYTGNGWSSNHIWYGKIVKLK